MKVAVATHHVSDSYMKSLLGPSDEPEGPGDDPLNAIGAIYGKVFDGTTYMSNFDDHPAAISDMNVVSAREEMHDLRGREWVPWGNVRGLNPAAEGVIAAQAAIAGAGAGEKATCIVNIEPYAGFWVPRGAAAINAIDQFMRSFTDNGGEEIWMWVDAREWQLEAIEFARWITYSSVTRILPEIYWTDFMPGADITRDQVTEFIVAARDLLVETYSIDEARVFPTFPGDGTPERMREAILTAHNVGFGRPNIWQRLNLRRDTANAIDVLKDPWTTSIPSPELSTKDMRAYDVANISPLLLKEIVTQAYMGGWNDLSLINEQRLQDIDEQFDIEAIDFDGITSTAQSEFEIF